jgi:hypothetical protein
LCALPLSALIADVETRLAAQALTDTLLEGRIRLQKVLSQLPRLPPSATFAPYREEHADELDGALAQLERLSEALFKLREVRRARRA